MDAPQQLSSLTCNLTIIQAQNVDFKSTGTLFVRYYLSAGNNKRIRLNTREIASSSEMISWNESFSLDCFGTKDSMDNLKQENVVFELRWRSKVPLLGRIGGSQLLGRAEIPWKEVCESPNMEIEKWVPMVSTIGHVGVSKPPKLQVGMKVQFPAMERRNGNVKKWNECGCKDVNGYSCEDYDVFALAAALEAF